MQVGANLEVLTTVEMRQEQTVTHQQIQALEMLTTPVLELHSMIGSELERNPVLEIDDAPEKDAPADNDEWLTNVLKLDEDRRFVPSSQHSWSADDEERCQYYLDNVSYEPTLHEQLLHQVRLLELPQPLVACCEVVISGLNDEGYLTSHPADLAMASGASLALVEKAIGTVQQLEPSGIGARDLRERLLLQLIRQGRNDSLACHLVSDHLEDIAENRLPRIARALGVTLADVEDGIEEIKGLSPRLPGNAVSPHEYIHEEVVVYEQDGRFGIRMNNDFLPSLRISRRYKELLRAANTPADVRSYIKEKIRGAVFLINSIIQRQTTIQRIAEAIVGYQVDFFRHGMDRLKPMTMAQIADQVGVHETTVSRAVAGKYLRCRHGLLPIRMFFSTGYQDRSGNAISNVVVKNVIRRLVDAEDCFLPLSDSQIARELKSEGVSVARRTVAKYRENMGIRSYHQRRKFKVS